MLTVAPRQQRDGGEHSGLSSSSSRELYIVLESESEVTSCDEDTESVWSNQNYPTDFVKDTSDTSSSESLTDESLAGIEYEVASLSEGGQQNPLDSFSSGTETYESDWKRQETHEDAEGGAEQSVLADASCAGSDGGTVDTSAEIPIRLRSCVRCNAQTHPFQFCNDCFKVRQSCFPPRPKRCRKKTSKFVPRKKQCIRLPTNVDGKDSKSDSCIESCSSQEIPLTPSDFNTVKSSNTENLCNLCFVKPMNGAFLHCRWVHIYCCYQCSLKIWSTSKRCPLCNGKIRQVLKVAVGKIG